MPHRPIIEDLAIVPHGATFVATRGTATNLALLPHLANIVAVWANPASLELFRACAGCPQLRALYVAHFKRLGEVPLAGARALEHLLLNWAPQLVDLSFLRALPTLRTLYLDSMKRINLETLPELPNLHGLHLGGGMWDALKVSSLSPLRRLPGLRFLTLSNVRVLDASLRPVASLTELREVRLPNFFEVEEFARLSAALPNATGNALTPVFAAFEDMPAERLPHRCSQCGGPRRMMTGKPAVLLCPNCDAAKMRKRIAQWEAGRSSAQVSGAC